MIIDRHSAVFLHIGKTAGTALEQALHGRLPKPSVADYKLLFGWCDRTNIYLQHASLKSVKRILSPEVWAAYRKFTIVRNPVHRIISVYNYSYWRRGGRKISFSEFLECLSDGIAHETRRGGGHLPLQTEFTHLDGALAVDYVGRFEQLPSAVEDISALLGLPDPLVLPVRRPRNRQSHDVFISDLTTSDLRHIVSCYYADFQAFNYSTAPEDYALKPDSLPAQDFIDLSFGELKLRADGHRSVIEELRRYFRYMETSTDTPPTSTLRIVEREDGLYRIDSKWDQYPPLNFGELIAAIRTEMMYEYSRVEARLPYFGSAVTVDGKAVALLGAGLGKSTLAT